MYEVQEKQEFTWCEMWMGVAAFIFGKLKVRGWKFLNPFSIFMQSKQKNNDQELIQSHPTSHPQYQKGKKDTHKIWLMPTKDTHI